MSQQRDEYAPDLTILGTLLVENLGLLVDIQDFF